MVLELQMKSIRNKCTKAQEEQAAFAFKLMQSVQGLRTMLVEYLVSI